MKDKPLDLTKPFKFRGGTYEDAEVKLLDSGMAEPCSLLFKWKNKSGEWNATYRLQNGRASGSGIEQDNDIINIPEEPKWREFRSVEEVIPLIGKYLIRNKHYPNWVELLSNASPDGMTHVGSTSGAIMGYAFHFQHTEMSNDGGKSWMPFGVLE